MILENGEGHAAVNSTAIAIGGGRPELDISQVNIDNRESLASLTVSHSDSVQPSERESLSSFTFRPSSTSHASAELTKTIYQCRCGKICQKLVFPSLLIS